MEYAKQFGDYLRFIREEVYNESLRPFAVRVEFSAGYIGKLELAQVGIPRRATIARIAKRLNLDPDILLVKAGYAPDNPDVPPGEDHVALKLNRLPPDVRAIAVTIIDTLVATYHDN